MAFAVRLTFKTHYKPILLFMKAMIFSILIVLPIFIKAQASSDTNQTSILPDIQEMDIDNEIQISFDVSSMTAVLLGGNPESSFHLGLQVRRVIGNTAYRFTGEFYPQTRLYPFFSNRMLKRRLAMKSGIWYSMNGAGCFDWASDWKNEKI